MAVKASAEQPAEAEASPQPRTAAKTRVARWLGAAKQAVKVEVDAEVVNANQKTPPAPVARTQRKPAPVIADVAKRVVQVVTNTVDDTAKAPLPSAPKAAAAPPELPSPVEVIGSLVFNVYGAVIKVAVGPPKLPPGSTVTVKSSTLEVADGHVVPADWYYPAGDEPPERMIYLQHGFLASGPMYSYTAAYLAEATNSVVVAPSLTSNPYARDSLWLGGDGMHRAVADLFVGDREALTQSALAAGYAEQYGLDPATAVLPRRVALVGHSLGGGLVAGVAGYMVDNGTADDLVGVILLDGVPPDGVLPSALTKLAAYEKRTGRYIPVREIGAPPNNFNSGSTVNEDLAAARPDRFNGVVLVDGTHMDGMQGGNPLIQFAAYLVAGFPTAQNPPAVQELAVTWLDDWFQGRTGVGDDLVPGSTIEIETPKGTARGIVIGQPVPAAGVALAA
ncbi:hypothetical protein [Mycobacterium hubeiense]|uniref:hypothetical protein n=1 Tax=Mycobacterium hubeiense TaxID=1867256 RepID=UPI000C7EA863|nr:hypothetical protein [Mycobacterium sp. QGD 101]